jgi:hypothetical protein
MERPFDWAELYGPSIIDIFCNHSRAKANDAQTETQGSPAGADPIDASAPEEE